MVAAAIRYDALCSRPVTSGDIGAGVLIVLRSIEERAETCDWSLRAY